MPLDIRIPGDHNVENALAAIAVAKLQAVPTAGIVQVLKTFTGVRHRTQYVETYQDRQFYNDSKATNLVSTEMALKGFDQPVILLAGGLDRGNTFEKLAPALKAHVKTLIVFGETAEKWRTLGVWLVFKILSLRTTVRLLCQLLGNIVRLVTSSCYRRLVPVGIST